MDRHRLNRVLDTLAYIMLGLMFGLMAAGLAYGL